MNTKKITLIVMALLAGIFILTSAGRLGENVDLKEICVIQDPYDGDVHVYTQPGLYNQNLGTVTKYLKSFLFWFDGKNGHYAPIPTKFYDGGHADIPGSIRVDLPLDVESMVKIQTKFGSMEAIIDQLEQTMQTSVNMSGPLMSSKESYAAKKNDLLFYIEDQAKNGIYKTTQREGKIKDELSGQDKVVTVVEVLMDTIKKQPLRQETSIIKEYNIRLSQLSLGDFIYDKVVKDQIAMQQQQIMKVQTGIANAKRAEQDAITTEQQGKADAATAKWKQEVIKAQEVTKAEQELAVQELAAKTAELYKKEQVLIGEGNAERKKLEFQANGALEQKLAALQNINKYWADAFSKYTGNVTPTWQSGSGGTVNGFANQMDFMNLRTMNELSMNLKAK